MKKLVVSALFVLAAAGVAAQEESAVVEMWTCELKEGKTIEEVKATNSKWVALINQKVENGEVSSHVLSNVVGNPETFGFADIFPSLEIWAEAKRAGQGDDFKEIDDEFDAQSDCTSNSLHRADKS